MPGRSLDFRQLVQGRAQGSGVGAQDGTRSRNRRGGGGRRRGPAGRRAAARSARGREERDAAHERGEPPPRRAGHASSRGFMAPSLLAGQTQAHHPWRGIRPGSGGSVRNLPLREAGACSMRRSRQNECRSLRPARLALIGQAFDRVGFCCAARLRGMRAACRCPTVLSAKLGMPARNMVPIWFVPHRPKLVGQRVRS